MKEKKLIHTVAKWMVDILLVCAVAGTVLAPLIVRPWLAEQGYRLDTKNLLVMAASLISSGVCVVLILWQLRKIFRTLMGGNPFVQRNVDCFFRIAVLCFVIAVIYLLKCVLWFTVATVVIVAVFVVAGVLCLTLRDVFREAVRFKEENDYTI